jgi:hypothetical protein
MECNNKIMIERSCDIMGVTSGTTSAQGGKKWDGPRAVTLCEPRTPVSSSKYRNVGLRTELSAGCGAPYYFCYRAIKRTSPPGATW